MHQVSRLTPATRPTCSCSSLPMTPCSPTPVALPADLGSGQGGAPARASRLGGLKNHKGGQQQDCDKSERGQERAGEEKRKQEEKELS